MKIEEKSPSKRGKEAREPQGRGKVTDEEMERRKKEKALFLLW